MLRTEMMHFRHLISSNLFLVLLVILFFELNLVFSSSYAALDDRKREDLLEQDTKGQDNTTMSRHIDSIRDFEMDYPSNWTKVSTADNVTFYPEPENFVPYLVIKQSQSRNTPLDEFVSLNLIEYRQELDHFSLLDFSGALNINGTPAQEIVYTYLSDGDTTYKVAEIWFISGSKAYLIKYLSDAQEANENLPIIREIIDTLELQRSILGPETATRDDLMNPQIKITDDPYDVVLNPNTNLLYVTNLRSDTVSVIDASSDRLLSDIRVGRFPTSVAVNPDSNYIYTTNSYSDTVSIIDGSTNGVIKNITVGKRPETIVVDSTEEGLAALAFVANSESNTVSVIDAAKNVPIDELEVGSRPVFVAINSITNRLYVVNSDSNDVSVIDYFISKQGKFVNSSISQFKVGEYPTSIEVDPVMNKLYVVNSFSDTVSVIDGGSNLFVRDINVGVSPYDAELDPNTNLLYVANLGSNTVSVINSSINYVIKNVTVGKYPVLVYYNPISHTVYISNLGSRTFSELNSTDSMVGITFGINPRNAPGNIECNGNTISDLEYVRFALRERIRCNASVESDLLFQSWTGEGLPSSQLDYDNNEIIFEVTKYGNVTANFQIPLEVTLPREYWNQLYAVLLTVMIPAIAGWFVPAIAGWLNNVRQRKYLRRCIVTIDKVSEGHIQDREEHLKRLSENKRRIDDLLTQGKISEAQYDILNEKLSQLEEYFHKG